MPTEEDRAEFSAKLSSLDDSEIRRRLNEDVFHHQWKRAAAEEELKRREQEREEKRREEEHRERTYTRRAIREGEEAKTYFKEHPIKAVLLTFSVIVLLFAWYFVWHAPVLKRAEKCEGEVILLETENADLLRDKSSLQNQVNACQERIAPLIERAAREFPGEELNTSLVKIIKRLDADPLTAPIAEVAAELSFIVERADNKPTRHMSAECTVIIRQGENQLILTRGYQTDQGPFKVGQALLRADLTSRPTSLLIGKPIATLREADNIVAGCVRLGDYNKVVGGQIHLVINSSIRLSFDIPAQVVEKAPFFYVSDLSRGLQGLVASGSGGNIKETEE